MIPSAMKPVLLSIKVAAKRPPPVTRKVKAASRLRFARGAARAAPWVAAGPAGLYDMSHVLGLKPV